MTEEEEDLVTHTVARTTIARELKDLGYMIRAMVYEHAETCYIEYGKGEMSMPTVLAVTEVDVLTSFEKNSDWILDIIENNQYGIVKIDETNISQILAISKLLGSSFDKDKSYDVAFFITQPKSNGKAINVATKITEKKTELKANAMEAAKRTAVTKLVKAMQKPIAGIMKSQGRTDMAKLVDTPEGKALIAGLLGVMQMMLPQLQSEEAAMIGEELRTQAMAYVTDSVGDLLDPLLTAFGEAAGSLPKII